MNLFFFPVTFRDSIGLIDYKKILLLIFKLLLTWKYLRKLLMKFEKFDVPYEDIL